MSVVDGTPKNNCEYLFHSATTTQEQDIGERSEYSGKIKTIENMEEICFLMQTWESAWKTTA